MERRTKLVLALNALVYASSFSSELFTKLGFEESYDGEMNAYFPLIRVIITCFLNFQFIETFWLKALLSMLQITTSFVVYNEFHHSIVSNEIGSIFPNSVFESIPVLFTIFFIFGTEFRNRKYSWEPLIDESQGKPKLRSKINKNAKYGASKNVKDRLDKAHKAFEEQKQEFGRAMKRNIKAAENLKSETGKAVKEKIDQAQKAFEEQKQELGRAVHRNFKAAEEFYEKHQEEIDQSIVPEALADKTINSVELDEEVENSSDSVSEDEPSPRKTEPTLTPLQQARQEAIRKQRERVAARIAQLKKR